MRKKMNEEETEKLIRNPQGMRTAPLMGSRKY